MKRLYLAVETIYENKHPLEVVWPTGWHLLLSWHFSNIFFFSSCVFHSPSQNSFSLPGRVWTDPVSLLTEIQRRSETICHRPPSLPLNTKTNPSTRSSDDCFWQRVVAETVKKPLLVVLKRNYLVFGALADYCRRQHLGSDPKKTAGLPEDFALPLFPSLWGAG